MLQLLKTMTIGRDSNETSHLKFAGRLGRIEWNLLFSWWLNDAVQEFPGTINQNANELSYQFT